MLTIVTTEIDYIQVLGESKNRVLVVKQRNSNRPVIVKSEETAARNDGQQSVDKRGDIDSRNNVGAMLQFHSTLFSKLRSLPFDTERMTLNEIDALRACPPNRVQGLRAGENWPAVFNDEVLTQNGRRKSVVKISYIEELANLRSLVKKVNLVMDLRAGLERGNANFVFELGQILAVDFFIGNHDRFKYNGYIVGFQNIFFQVRNNTITATGIDTYDVFSPWSNLNATIESLEAHRTETWPGRVLSHGAYAAREEIAQNAVTDILSMAYEGMAGSGAVAPCACPIVPSRKKALVCQFHKGISEGKSLLRAKYNFGDCLAELQSGIQSRWRIVQGKYA